MLNRILPIVVFLGLVIASGYIHGVHTDRWQQTGDIDEIATRIRNIPSQIGEWKGEDNAMDEEELKRAGIRGCLYRTYRNARSGEVVGILVVCGKPGPISVHTPDVCYANAGFEQVGSQVKKNASAGEKSASYWQGNFRKVEANIPSELEILWMWSDKGNWEAPEFPRMTFARSPFLFKLYFIRQLTTVNKKDKEKSQEVVHDFMKEFFPPTEKALFPN